MDKRLIARDIFTQELEKFLEIEARDLRNCADWQEISAISKAEMKRIQNRAAVRKCREKSKLRMQEISARVDYLQRENEQLKEFIIRKFRESASQ